MNVMNRLQNRMVRVAGSVAKRMALQSPDRAFPLVRPGHPAYECLSWPMATGVSRRDSQH